MEIGFDEIVEKAYIILAKLGFSFLQGHNPGSGIQLKKRSFIVTMLQPILNQKPDRIVFLGFSISV